MKRVQDLDYHLINTRNPGTQYQELCEKAYLFWYESWLRTFNQLGVRERQNLFADDFLDREVGVLTFKKEPVGLFFNNWFDVSRPSIINHSYFKNYPQEVKSYLQKDICNKVMVLSYMTLSEDWRRGQTDIPISELLFSLGVKRFEYSQADTLIGYIRTDQRTHEIFYRHGGQKISQSVAYNVGVDFCTLSKDSMSLSSLPGVAVAADFLWDKMNKQQSLFIRRGSMNEVIKEFKSSLPNLESTFVNFPWELRPAYAEYLAQTYQYIQHSTKLLAHAAEKTKNSELKECFLHHVAEEVGHENWAKNDLKALGYDLSDFNELPQTNTLYSQIYDGIDEHGPAPIVGYSLALEGLSAKRCPEIAKRLIETYGKRCSTLIYNHGEIDQDHFSSAFDILRYFNDDELKVVQEFLVLSVESYTAFLEQIAIKALRQAKQGEATERVMSPPV